MEILALIAVLIAFVWIAVIVARGGLLAVALSVMVAGVVLGPPFFSLPGGPVPLTIDRILLGLLALMYVVYRYLGWVDRSQSTAADAVLLALVGCLTLNVFMHDWKINRSQPVSYLVFFWFMPLTMYWVARHMKITERGIRWVFGTFAVLGMYLAATAVCEARYQWQLVWPRYIVSPSFVEFLGRGRGPLLNPPGNGVLMALCMACGLMFWPRADFRGKLAIALGFVPLLLGGMYFTLTRSVWMGAAGALLVVVGLTMPRRWRMPAIAGAMIAGTLTLAVGWENLLAFKRDKNLSAAETADSTTLRPILAYVAWEMFCDRPIMGWGIAHYLDENDPYLHDRSTELVLEKVRPYVQHNAFLSLLVETGLVGLTGFVLLLILWLRTAWNLWNDQSSALWKRQVGLVFMALLAGYLPNAMFHDTTIIQMMNMLLLFWAAVLLNISLLRCTDDSRSEEFADAFEQRAASTASTREKLILPEALAVV